MDLPGTSSISSMSSVYSTSSMIPASLHQEDLYATHTDLTSSARFFGTDRISLDQITADRTDFEDETYQSSEEAEIKAKI